MARNRSRSHKQPSVRAGMIKRRLVSSIIVASILFVIGAGLYLMPRLTSHALTQNSYKSSFDYGQISAGTFSQPAGAVFTGRMISEFNFNNTAPQHMVFRIGYLTSRVQALTVTCLTDWGCYKSTAGDKFGRNNPHVAVCIDVPNGHYPETTQLFSIQFKAVTALNDSNTWWTSDSIIAPNTCQANPNSDGFVVNQIDGSGVCGGQFEPCDYGPNPGGETYTGFGPRGNTVGPEGTGPEGSGAGPGLNGSGGGSSGATANIQSNQSNPLPASSLQGDEKQPILEPSPFFDGKNYQPGSVGSLVKSASLKDSVVGRGWLYLLLIAVAVIGALALYWYWRRKK